MDVMFVKIGFIQSQIDFPEITDPVFILGDHTGVTEEEEGEILEAGAKIISVGPISLHSNHCITLIHNELDRLEAEVEPALETEGAAD